MILLLMNSTNLLSSSTAIERQDGPLAESVLEDDQEDTQEEEVLAVRRVGPKQRRPVRLPQESQGPAVLELESAARQPNQGRSYRQPQASRRQHEIQVNLSLLNLILNNILRMPNAINYLLFIHTSKRTFN